MIKEICFEKEYIQNFRNIYKKANSEYVEKTIFAFELLALLVKSGMDFIFKGGTEIKDFEITGKYKIVNRLRKILPEAFYYWFLVSQIEKKQYHLRNYYVR
ncbi:MAG: hypothetical protein KAW88_06630 [Candidatus Cloacimonetes bacterium]|nr:hypothetical protein [Candidatus Cloacimonadota bacterium]